MAKVFQNMLQQNGLTQKILVVNADNDTTNDRQMTKLAALGQLVQRSKPCLVLQPHTATFHKGPPCTIQHSYLPGSSVRQ